MRSSDPDSGWRQVTLWCSDWQAAEQMAVTHLGPRLTETQHAEIVTSWWFVRKGASWRVRYLPTSGQEEQASTLADQTMRDLTANAAIRRWAATIYEPESHAFGGPDGMALAHDLFHLDSRHILDYVRRRERRQARSDHRRELGMLLASALMRGAGQDWYEQGDIWARVAEHRPASQPPSDTAAEAVRQLITARADTAHGPLARAPDWPAAFGQTGQDLAELAHQGRLTRGLRALLAHHILFAWNRAGIPAHEQALLAATAARVIFHSDPPPGPICGPVIPQPASLNIVTTDTATPDPEQLRAALADHIRRLRTFRTPQVEAVFRTVPRHLFLPGVDLHTAYAPQVVVTKRDQDGTAISSASSPNVVATMLEQLDVQPGHRVLEIGAGTGINAALLSELVGPTGQVTTVDIDDGVVAGARRGLAAAGYEQVEVICADGADGHPAGAPYDRIIVTAGAGDLAPAWWQQLAGGGRLVVPLRLHGSGLTRSIAFDPWQPGRMVSNSARVCGFVPMQGTAPHAGRSVHLTDDVALSLDDSHSADEAALGQAFTHPAHQHWTGVTIGDGDPVEHLDLWLATTTSHFARLSVGAAARDSGRVTPALRWAGAALHDDGGAVAYLTLRPHSNETNELGVIAHGPDSRQLAAHTAELLHYWDHQRPTQPIITAHPAGTPDEQLPHGTRIDKPDTRLTIAW